MYNELLDDNVNGVLASMEMNVKFLHDEIKLGFDVIFIHPAKGVRSIEVKPEQLYSKLPAFVTFTHPARGVRSTEVKP